MHESPVSFLVIKNCFLGATLLLCMIFIKEMLDNSTKIVFCRGNTTNAIYIRIKNQTDILIDSGEDKGILTCLGKYMPFFDKTIDHFILTSSSIQYAKSLAYLAHRYRFNSIYTPAGIEFMLKDQPSHIVYKTHHNLEQVPSILEDASYGDLRVITINKEKQIYAVVYSENNHSFYLANHVSSRYIPSFLKILEDSDNPEKIYILNISTKGSKSDLFANIVELAEPTYLVINGSIESELPMTSIFKLNRYKAQNRLFFANKQTDVVFYLGKKN